MAMSSPALCQRLEEYYKNHVKRYEVTRRTFMEYTGICFLDIENPRIKAKGMGWGVVSLATDGTDHGGGDVPIIGKAEKKAILTSIEKCGCTLKATHTHPGSVRHIHYECVEKGGGGKCMLKEILE